MLAVLQTPPQGPAHLGLILVPRPGPALTLLQDAHWGL